MNPAIWVAVIGGLVSIATVFYKSWTRANTIKLAVFAEIRRLIYVLQKHTEWWESGGGDIDSPLIPFSTPIFDELEQDLGNIDADVVGNVVRFYGAIKFINALQAKKHDFKDNNQFKKLYGEVLKNVWNCHGRQFDEVFEHYGLEIPPKPSEAHRSRTQIRKVERAGGVASG